MSYNTAEMNCTMETLSTQTALYRFTRGMGGSAQASVAKDFFANPSTTATTESVVNTGSFIANPVFTPAFGAISTRPGGLDDDTTLHVQTLSKRSLSKKTKE
jgi:hypothetical protein